MSQPVPAGKSPGTFKKVSPQVAGGMSQKRFRASHDVTAIHPAKRLKAQVILRQEARPLKQSLESFEPEEKYNEELFPRFSYDAISNYVPRSARLSMEQHDDHELQYLNSQANEGLLRNILAYNPNARRPTFDVERPAARDQLISDFQHVGNMVRYLIREYSKICIDLSSRYDAVNTIQNYLTRYIYNTMLPNIHDTSCLETKAAALATLTKIIFVTLSNDPSTNRIGGLLHARVCDFVGGAMVKVASTMSEDDIRHFVQDKDSLYQQMKELQKLVNKLRWPIDGMERVMDLFQRRTTQLRRGMLKRTLRNSLSVFQRRRRVVNR